MLKSKEETIDLLVNRMASQIKVVRELTETPEADDYKSTVVEACKRLIKIMELQQGGPGTAALRRRI